MTALRNYFDSRRLRDPMVLLVEATVGITDGGSPAVIAIWFAMELMVMWTDPRTGSLDSNQGSMHSARETS